MIDRLLRSGLCRFRPQYRIGSLTAVLLAFACTAPDPDSDIPKRALPTSIGTASSLETEDTLPSALKGIVVEPVEGRTGPGDETFYIALRTSDRTDYLYRQIGTRTFPLGLRRSAPDLTQYPCTSCHQGQKIIGNGTERDTTGVHHNIQPVHPEETGAQCTTCHAVDDVGTLRLESGGVAPMSHAYRLCAQCHFPEVDSWANGAHGKRLVGWRGRRVVMGCADCHNPHTPATELRIPYAGPELPGGLVGKAGMEAGGGAHD